MRRMRGMLDRRSYMMFLERNFCNILWRGIIVVFSLVSRFLECPDLSICPLFLDCLFVHCFGLVCLLITGFCGFWGYGNFLVRVLDCLGSVDGYADGRWTNWKWKDVQHGISLPLPSPSPCPSPSHSSFVPSLDDIQTPSSSSI